MASGGVSDPPDGLPVAEAIFVTEPASKSAWVTAYSPVQTTVSAGSRFASPFPTAGTLQTTAAILSSDTTRSEIKTLPVFTTV